jgi:hypothetical protein
MALANPPLRVLMTATIWAAFSGLIALPDATARASFDSAYTLEQTFNAALRMIRVDRGYKVTEKDPGAAYVLFDYKDTGDRTTPGAIEMVASGQSVKVVVQLPQMPKYHEQILADALAKKLRDDFGEPPRRPIPPPPAPDGGADGGAD